MVSPFASAVAKACRQPRPEGPAPITHTRLALIIISSVIDWVVSRSCRGAVWFTSQLSTSVTVLQIERCTVQLAT
eukprot:m.39296 g.39296  ORF g.39296 m.39296 type:complete len:75 (-) comp10294_c0_seq1:169-393(-)